MSGSHGADSARERTGTPRDQPFGDERDDRACRLPVTRAAAEQALASSGRRPGRVARWWARLATPAAISVGAVFGANARYLVGNWAVTLGPSAFPWGTLLINVSGSLALGFYLALATERFAGRALTRLMVATGFLGAYTTFSIFSYETVMLIQHGLVLNAVFYLLASVLLSIAAAASGMFLARRW